MSRPALSVDEMTLRGQRGDVTRVSRAEHKGGAGVRGGRPKFPDRLPEAARPLWNDVVKQLARRRTLTPGDGPQLELFVRTHLQWESACKDVEERGVMIDETRFSRAGNEYQVRIVNPCVKIAADLYSELKDSLKEMGLTGLAREKVPQVKKADRHPASEPGTVAFFRANAPADEQPGAALSADEDLDLETPDETPAATEAAIDDHTNA